MPRTSSSDNQMTKNEWDECIGLTLAPFYLMCYVIKQTNKNIVCVI